MLLGDIGETLRLAAPGTARRRPHAAVSSHRLHAGQPGGDADEAFEYFEHAQVEDKYDGIRAQAHCGGGQVRLFSRTLDEVTPSFPELAGPLANCRAR